jgi:hypothetical protein
MKNNRVSRMFLGAALAAMVAAFGVGACSDDEPTEQVLTPDNCANACSRYAACYDATYDVTGCTNRCVANIDNAVITVQTSEDCLDCIGDSSCLSAVYNCSSICQTVITFP